MEMPFTEATLDEIKAQLKRLEEAQELAKIATLAGFDVEAQKARLSEAQAQLVRVRAAFFPNR